MIYNIVLSIGICKIFLNFAPSSGSLLACVIRDLAKKENGKHKAKTADLPQAGCMTMKNDTGWTKRDGNLSVAGKRLTAGAERPCCPYFYGFIAGTAHW